MSKVKHLMFSKKYLDKLLKGEKLATIRLRDVGLKPGDRFFMHSGGYVLGIAEVTDISKKRLRELTLEDALRDGFKSLEELLAVVKEHYPRIKENTVVHIIGFKWIKRFERPISSEELPWKGTVNITEIAKEALNKLNNLTDEERRILLYVANEGSIRKAALRLGDLKLRPVVRGVLRKVYHMMRKGEGRY